MELTRQTGAAAERGRPAGFAGRPGTPAPGDGGLRPLLRNGVALLLAYVLPRVFTLAAVVVAARVLGAGAFGAYGTAAAYTVVLSILATLGMMPLLIRDIARAPEAAARLIRAAHVVKTGSNALMLAALPLLALGPLGYPPEVAAAAFLLGVGYALAAYAENLGAYFQAVERMGAWMQANAAFGLVTGGLGAVLVVTTESLVWFCAAPVAGQAVALAWLLRRAPAEVRRGGPVSGDEVARLLRALVPFALAFVALTAYYKVDVLLLARWRAAAEVGIYAAAYKFIDIAHALALVAAGAVYPRLSRALADSGEGARRAGARAAEVMLVAAAPAAFLLWLVREPLIRTLYGPEYGQAAAVLAFLAPAVVPLAVNLLAGYVLGAGGRMQRVAAGYAGALALNVGLNAWLIPAHGARGAAAAMLVSETLLAVGLLAMLGWRPSREPERRHGMAGVAEARP